eukprot:CAMPEP_0177654508 /NCGR_PEP_ID=MMETSP0447-20121125/14375_1 /TAXON_ID=0 /ORGANISM="Stygamoeba regulata, Strain BSH-02190019" /LENGTH=591 /DNA_ID=CAMNT_0019158173 /DNA_START=194 /DNA_END=1969 /DNA_ORIENTATION=-
MRKNDAVFTSHAHTVKRSKNDLPMRLSKESSSVVQDDDEDEKDGSRKFRRLRLFGYELPAEADRMALLILLYIIQGVPIGLTFGSIPFLLSSKASYTQIGVFSLASYPYSLKLFWSPIVDAVYLPGFGRRKTWIVPIQILSGLLLLYLSTVMEDHLSGSEVDVWMLACLFFGLILLTATQDIAVDGWAITMLSEANQGFAGTCQTIGLNIGYFMSFTIFLAFHSADFCNKFLRSTETASEEGVLTLAGYLQFWGIMYLGITVLLAVFKHERPTSQKDAKQSVSSVYRKILSIIRLAPVKQLMILLLVYKVGFVANDSVTALKLIEKGFKKEYMGVFVLIEFPFQILFAVVTGRWSAGDRPLDPWLYAFAGRLAVCVAGPLLVYIYPGGDVSWTMYLAALCVNLLSSFTSTVMFVCLGGFFARISDQSIGGTYLTLLNTISNFGGTWPRFFVLWLVDALSQSQCYPSTAASSSASSQALDLDQVIYDCSSPTNRASCLKSGGRCEKFSDGYYVVCAVGVCVGALLLWGYLWKAVKWIQSHPPHKWTIANDPTRQSRFVVVQLDDDHDQQKSLSKAAEEREQDRLSRQSVLET